MMYGKIGVDFLKATLTIGLMLSIFKIIIGWYYGYKNINGIYGLSYFFNWRVNHIDPKVSKTFYKPIGLNEQDLKNKILYKYLDAVQGLSRDFMTQAYDFEKKEYVKKTKDGKEVMRTEMPYYSYGFTDAFVYPSNKNWMLFNNNEKNLNIELEYLKFRGNFISQIYNIKFNDENKNIYFGSYKDGKKVNGRTIKKGEFFNKADNEKMVEFFKRNVNFIDVVKIGKILLNTNEQEEEYKITMTKDSAKMQAKLETDVMDLVQSIFPEEKIGFKLTADDVNGFFYRVAVIKMRPMDAHILNRIYSLCTMLFACVSDDSIKVPEYEEYIKKISDLEKELKESSADKDRINRKKAILNKKKNSLRAEIVFVTISQLFASLYGNGKFILDSKDDKRSFFEKYGSPNLALEKDFKKDSMAWKKNLKEVKEDVTKLLEALNKA